MRSIPWIVSASFSGAIPITMSGCRIATRSSDGRRTVADARLLPRFRRVERVVGDADDIGSSAEGEDRVGNARGKADDTVDLVRKRHLAPRLIGNNAQPRRPAVTATAQRGRRRPCLAAREAPRRAMTLLRFVALALHWLPTVRSFTVSGYPATSNRTRSATAATCRFTPPRRSR